MQREPTQPRPWTSHLRRPIPLERRAHHRRSHDTLEQPKNRRRRVAVDPERRTHAASRCRDRCRCVGLRGVPTARRRSAPRLLRGPCACALVGLESVAARALRPRVGDHAGPGRMVRQPAPDPAHGLARPIGRPPTLQRPSINPRASGDPWPRRPPRSLRRPCRAAPGRARRASATRARMGGLYASMARRFRVARSGDGIRRVASGLPRRGGTGLPSLPRDRWRSAASRERDGLPRIGGTRAPSHVRSVSCVLRCWGRPADGARSDRRARIRIVDVAVCVARDRIGGASMNRKRESRCPLALARHCAGVMFGPYCVRAIWRADHGACASCVRARRTIMRTLANLHAESARQNTAPC